VCAPDRQRNVAAAEGRHRVRSRRRCRVGLPITDPSWWRSDPWTRAGILYQTALFRL
jgi:hypothetical protein